MNQYNAVGNVTNNSEVKYTPAGDAILNFNLAVNSGWGDKQITTFFRCSLFGKRAETLAPMILKGQKIGITGEIINREYTDKDGAKKYSLECRLSNVTLLGKKEDSQSDRPERNQAHYSAPVKSEHASGFSDPMDFEDSIPFSAAAR